MSTNPDIQLITQHVEKFVTSFFNQEGGLIESAMNEKKRIEEEERARLARIQADRLTIYEKCKACFNVIFNREKKGLLHFDQYALLDENTQKLETYVTVPSIMRDIMIIDDGKTLRLMLTDGGEEMEALLIIDQDGHFVDDHTLYKAISDVFDQVISEFIKRHIG